MDQKDRLILALSDEVAKMSVHLSTLAERRPFVTDDVSKLKSLGTSGTEYPGSGPSASVLETFPNRFPDQEYQVVLTTDEVTSRCPKTNQPDFATLRITYSPKERCVETKSLKLYLFRYRDEGTFMESMANQVMKDLVGVLDPKRLLVEMDFAPRGGIGLVVRALHDPLAEQMEKVVAETLKATEDCQRYNEQIGKLLTERQDLSRAS